MATANLYEEDYLLWLETTANFLKEKNFAQLDLINLIEEIEALGREERRKLEIYLRQLLKHLLFYQYWIVPDCKHHWATEIANFRLELKKLIKSKTLYNYLIQVMDEVYSEALILAKKKSELKSFPEKCPYTIEQILDIDYYPEIES
nr:DUF29 domain-containing protein [Gloeothece verrucosa]